MKELLDIATRHAYGEEAVEIVFIQAEGHYPKQLTKVQRGVPKATRGGGGRQSGKPNGSQLLPAVTRATTTRRPMILMRSSLLPLSGTSSARRGRLPIT
jgi:hypothetical protein